MPLVVSDFFRVIGIYVGVFEETGHKLCAQNARDGAVDQCFGNFPLFHLFHQAGIGGRKRQFHFDARLKRQLTGSFVRPSSVVNRPQFGYAEVV